MRDTGGKQVFHVHGLSSANRRQSSQWRRRKQNVKESPPKRGNELGAKVAGDVPGFSSRAWSYFRQALLPNIQKLRERGYKDFRFTSS